MEGWGTWQTAPSMVPVRASTRWGLASSLMMEEEEEEEDGDDEGVRGRGGREANE